VVGTGLTGSAVRTTPRPDGQRAGDTNGQGSNAFGRGWFALFSSGAVVTGTSSGTGGIGGY